MAKRKQTDSGTGVLKMAGLIAMLGNMEHPSDIKKQNTWKKRMLSVVHGIDFPEDFDSLSEEEKQRRLDGAIKIATEK